MTQIFFRMLSFAIPKYASFSEAVYYFSEKPKYVKKYTVVILMIRAIFLWKPFLEIIDYGGKSGKNPKGLFILNTQTHSNHDEHVLISLQRE